MEPTKVSALDRARAAVAFGLLITLLVACGGAGAATPTAPGGTTATPGGSFVFPSADLPTQVPASGVTVRLLNVWAEPGKLGPKVELRVRNGDALTSAAPGELTSFVPVPKAKFGDNPADLVIVSQSAPDKSIGVGNLAAGDRVTVLVHGEENNGVITMRGEPIWEQGEPFYGLPFPTVAAGAATLAVYPGPLLALGGEEQSVWLRTADGACLIEPTFHEEKTGGFGGTGVTYFELPAERTIIDAGQKGAPGCTKIEPTIGTVAITARPGEHWGLVPWGQSGALKLLVLDLNGP